MTGAPSVGRNENKYQTAIGAGEKRGEKLISMPKGRSKKITIMATMVTLVLAVSIFSIGLLPTAAKRVPPDLES